MHRKESILIFSDWFEPGFKGGGPIRSIVNFCNAMYGQYNLYVFTADRDLGDKQPYTGIVLDRWIQLEQIHVFYASPRSQNWKIIRTVISEINPEYIYLNSMFSRFFTIYPLLMNRFGAITASLVLAPRGMLHQGAVQYKNRKKRFFLEALNLLGIPSRLIGHATDEQEAHDIKSNLGGIKRVLTISNYSAYVPDFFSKIQKRQGHVKLIFISRISPKKNLLFLLTLLKQVDNNIDCHLTIRGSVEEEEYWEDCLKIINELPGYVKVTFDGPALHAEINTLLQNNHLFVLPTFGENFGHAIFESLLAGRPILISDQTPWRNLMVHKAGWDLPLENAKAFVDVINRVAHMDDYEFQQWCEGAWQYAKSYQENSNLKEKYTQLFS